MRESRRERDTGARMNEALEGQSRAADHEPLTSALRFSQSLAPTNIVTPGWRQHAELGLSSASSASSSRRRAYGSRRTADHQGAERRTRAASPVRVGPRPLPAPRRLMRARSAVKPPFPSAPMHTSSPPRSITRAMKEGGLFYEPTGALQGFEEQYPSCLRLGRERELALQSDEWLGVSDAASSPR